MQRQRCKFCLEWFAGKCADIFCSDRCQNDSHNSLTPNKTCVVCGRKFKRFEHRSTDIPMCSKECFNVRNAAQQRKYKASVDVPLDNEILQPRNSDRELDALDVFEVELNLDYNMWEYPIKESENAK